MAYRDLRPLTLIVYSGFLVLLADARTWDMAVAIGKEVAFFTTNGTLLVPLETGENDDLSGIAYDDYTHTMFLSNTNMDTNSTIFTRNLTSKELETQRVLTNERSSHIIGLAYDSRTKNLFWTDTTESALMSLHVPSNKSDSGVPKLLLNLTDEIPRGISLDACNRRLYWANSNTSNPSIESSNLDGSDRITVVRKDLYEPMGVTVDHWAGKLYWINDDESIFYKIERSNLDGTGRQTLYKGRQHQPYSLAVDRNAIYWSDWTNKVIWTMKKDVKSTVKPKKWFSFKELFKNIKPKSIVARDNVGDFDCATMFEAERKNTVGSVTDTTEEESNNNVITSTEVGNSVTEISSRCFNAAKRDETTDTCHCKPGFDGKFCERSMCHNYCLHGECYITAGGLPRCKCSSSYQGPRCESNICDGYCLNGGQCSMKNSEPFCTCKSASGPRCENQYDMEEVCTIFCASKLPALSSIDTSSCRCSNKNQTVVEASTTCSEDLWHKTLVIVLSALLGVLTIVVGVLSYYVNKLRRRPRIRKRFVVSKAGITPLTARPQLPSDQCEIMIENCCNMNICETPCFEPKLRSDEQSVHKKDEKNSLLNNMEGNSC